MMSSIQVARLLVHCVLLGSLAELLFSFHMQSRLAFLQMVDAIIGKVISYIINGYRLGFKSPLQYLTFSWFGTKNKVM
jgi:hypothetical protein